MLIFYLRWCTSNYLLCLLEYDPLFGKLYFEFGIVRLGQWVTLSVLLLRFATWWLAIRISNASIYCVMISSTIRFSSKLIFAFIFSFVSSAATCWSSALWIGWILSAPRSRARMTSIKWSFSIETPNWRASFSNTFSTWIDKYMISWLIVALMNLAWYCWMTRLMLYSFYFIGDLKLQRPHIFVQLKFHGTFFELANQFLVSSRYIYDASSSACCLRAKSLGICCCIFRHLLNYYTGVPHMSP